jgi:hypothetical protein
MFVVKIVGGLGNQMFQYVFGQYLSKTYNVNVKYEISFYDDQPSNLDTRNYELGKFILDAPIIEDDFFLQLKNLNRREKIKYILSKTLFNITSSYFIIPESKYALFKSIPLFIRNRYYTGYWQNELFFQGMESEISKWFVLKEGFERKKQHSSILTKIYENNSISIGIRRGDFVQLNAACDINYYNKAVKIITKKINDPFFFIFSDDIDWCKKNMKLKYEHIFIESSKELPFENVELMSECKHNIISNSTYDWWGAYLNKNENKMIIAPKEWGLSKSLNCIEL